MSMINQKVYLSKSNRANPDYVSMVRVHLEDRGYEVVEHEGGEYDKKLLVQCKYMVMVGVEQPATHNDGIVKVGKGQYMQLKNRVFNRWANNLYFSHTNDVDGKEEPVFRNVEPGKILDHDNWTTAYGSLECNMSSFRKLLRIGAPAKSKDNGLGDPIDRDIGIGELLVQPVCHLACITLFD